MHNYCLEFHFATVKAPWIRPFTRKEKAPSEFLVSIGYSTIEYFILPVRLQCKRFLFKVSVSEPKATIETAGAGREQFCWHSKNKKLYFQTAGCGLKDSVSTVYFFDCHLYPFSVNLAWRKRLVPYRGNSNF